MRLKKETLWFEHNNKLMLVGPSEKILTIEGPIIKTLLQALKQDCEIEISLNEDEQSKLKSLLGSEFLLNEDSPAASANNEVVFSDGSRVESGNLNPQQDPKLNNIAIYAKYENPTSMVGYGGYDDDTGSVHETMYYVP